MLVMTKAPIIEEVSSANGRKGKRAKSGKVSDSLKKGYTRLKEAGGVPVIENLLGIGAVGANMPPVDGNLLITDPNADKKPDADADKKPEGMSKTTKIVLISVGVLAIAGIAYYLYARSKGGKVSSATIKA